MSTAEQARLDQVDDEGGEPWRAWGPYLSERAWGTVREDYSPGGTAWDYLPHDHARSRAYRWSEDGLAGISDLEQLFCFSLAFWNGRDPILKERAFGLTGGEGNHGEDAKDYWWYLDSTPTHSWMRWRYHYPQREFPYNDLVHTNRDRGVHDPEYELVDTGVFDEDRYWRITAEYAKAGPRDLCIRIHVENKGPDEETLHVLPHLWFRNTWSWGLVGREAVPRLTGEAGRLVGEHHTLGRIVLDGAGEPAALVCDNESNTRRLWNSDGGPRYPKDGINDHVVGGADSVNPEQRGTKGALHYVLTVPAGGTAEIRLRMRTEGPADAPSGSAFDTHLGSEFDEAMTRRQAEADEFFTALTPAACTPDEANVLRQAVAGMMWSKQFYHYNVSRWLEGDPAQPTPPEERRHGRNAHWWALSARDVIVMPDPWEYPWFAAWDLAFHCVALAAVDPALAKRQLLLLLQEWYLHPSGQIPAYEWAFSDDNPPVQAWAALQIFRMDGGTDYTFLKLVFHKLLMNFTWWVNRVDADGNNVFEGGFLGLDNIGPFDRDAGVPVGDLLEQSDGTAWMAMYALNLMDISLVLAEHDPVYREMVMKFFEHFGLIAAAANTIGLWNEEDGFFYDVLRTRNGATIPMKVRSVVGLLPLVATTSVRADAMQAVPELTKRVQWFFENQSDKANLLMGCVDMNQSHRLLTMVTFEQRPRILARMLDEAEFLSEHGLRALSRYHKEQPFRLNINGNDYSVDYQPGESNTSMFGGNSNWRGPVWFPVNYLLIDALDTHQDFFGDGITMPYPSGTERQASYGEIADDLSDRLVGIFLNDRAGRRPVFGDVKLFQEDPAWHDQIPFHEYFHGDTGAGLGAAHQTGWTALAINLLLRKGRPKKDA
ncbi:glucosidase [Catenulispora yoronensis]|uniref:Glucosidase n=1 Tax=Catenulispora yoronensis TaxID=450799 RepID=A0ABN2TP18_9ACTN